MQKKSKKKLQKDTEKKKKPAKKKSALVLQKKPSLEEFLEKASDWHKKWGKLCKPPLDNLKMYLDYQKMFYISTINDMSDADYNKFVSKQTKSVVDRLNNILSNNSVK